MSQHKPVFFVCVIVRVLGGHTVMTCIITTEDCNMNNLSPYFWAGTTCQQKSMAATYLIYPGGLHYLPARNVTRLKLASVMYQAYVIHQYDVPGLRYPSI